MKEKKDNKNHSFKIIFLYSYAMHPPSDATTHYKYKCAKLCALLSKHEKRIFGQISSQYISGQFLITEHTIQRQEHQTSEIESVAATVGH